MYKLIIFFSVLSLNVYAETRVIISMLDGQSPCGGECDFRTQQKADAWIADNISNDSWGKKERWEVYKDQTTCLVIEDVMTEVPDVTISFPDPMPEGYVHPVVSIVDHQRCRMPAQYTIEQFDITQEVKDKKTKKDKNTNDLILILSKVKDGSAKLEDIINYIVIKENL